MEKLNSDEKMLVLMNLSAQEILKVCQTNKELSRVCGDIRYNPLWYQKIKEDFNIYYNGKNRQNAFEEYKRLHMLYSTPIYTVTFSDLEKPQKSFSNVFADKLSAEMNIVNTAQMSYTKVKASLDYNGYVNSDVYKIILSEKFILKPENLGTDETDYGKEYENDKLKLYSLLDAKQRKGFEYYLKDILSSEYSDEKALFILETFFKKYKVEEYRKEIKYYVVNILENDSDNEDNENEDEE